MRVRLLPSAERDLRGIYDYVTVDNPGVARALVGRVRDRILGLADFPNQGRSGSGGNRELVIVGTPYLAVYRVTGCEVLVLRVLHGARKRS
jgi:toxin ParE1/3/4